MRKGQLSAGDIAEARCTRCRTVTNHTIVAMVGDTIARVQCNTCDGVHKYYSPTSGRASAPNEKKAGEKSPAPRRTAARQALAQQEEWAAACSEADPENAADYSMSRPFKVNDLVRHPVFGLGLVKTTQKPNKMEVLFESGLKLLRCSL